MISIEVKQRIRHMNPWLEQPQRAEEYIGRFLPSLYIPRKVDMPSIVTNRVFLVVGPRQAGKSTFVWNTLKPLAPHILFLNMEDPLLRVGCASAVEFTAHIHETYPFIKAVFIDEAQHMAEAGLFVKGLVDARLDMSLWITGSSSFRLRSKTRESLAGRATRRKLLPFSMGELLSYRQPASDISRRYESEQILNHQLIYGSYPAVYLIQEPGEKINLLNDLVEALILRDTSDLFRIKRIDAFRRLLTLLAGQIGQIVNLSELAAICGVDVGSIGNYIEIMEESHIIKVLSPFAGGRRREITRAPKVFFIDNGIRNQLLNLFSPASPMRTDRGALFENWAFTEICKAVPITADIKFWRSKGGAEIDFVIENAGKIVAVEVKSTALRHPKLGRSARSFIDAYRPERFALLNLTLDDEMDMEGCRVNFLTPCRFIQWLTE